MVHPGREPDLQLTMLSQPRLLTAARAMVNNLAQRLGFSEIHAGQLSLAVDEALCNVINHGYDRRPDGQIEIRVWAVEEESPYLAIVIEDRAVQVDPATIRSRDLDDIRPGGLGVYIMKEIMDEVVYEHREGGGMRLSMRKSIPDGTSCVTTDESPDGVSPVEPGRGRE